MLYRGKGIQNDRRDNGDWAWLRGGQIGASVIRTTMFRIGRMQQHVPACPQVERYRTIGETVGCFKRESGITPLFMALHIVGRLAAAGMPVIFTERQQVPIEHHEEQGLSLHWSRRRESNPYPQCDKTSCASTFTPQSAWARRIVLDN